MLSFSLFSYIGTLRRLFVIVAVVFSFLQIPQSVFGASPSWLTKGAYVRYETRLGSNTEVGYVYFLNGTQTNEACFVVLQWECMDIEGNKAMLDINVTHTTKSKGVAMYQTRVYVNTEDRDVTLLNETYIGKTWLWLPRNPAQGEIIEINDSTNATADVKGWMATCQGAQKSFWVYGFGGYDLDTGILLSPYFEGDPILQALGILSIKNLNIADTNINLGPREWLPEIIMSLPYVLIIASIGIIFLPVLRRRRKRSRSKRSPRVKENRL